MSQNNRIYEYNLQQLINRARSRLARLVRLKRLPRSTTPISLDLKQTAPNNSLYLEPRPIEPTHRDSA